MHESDENNVFLANNYPGGGGGIVGFNEAGGRKTVLFPSQERILRTQEHSAKQKTLP